MSIYLVLEDSSVICTIVSAEFVKKPWRLDTEEEEVEC
jgi:hypothetical protein